MIASNDKYFLWIVFVDLQFSQSDEHGDFLIETNLRHRRDTNDDNLEESEGKQLQSSDDKVNNEQDNSEAEDKPAKRYSADRSSSKKSSEDMKTQQKVKKKKVYSDVEESTSGEPQETTSKSEESEDKLLKKSTEKTVQNKSNDHVNKKSNDETKKTTSVPPKINEPVLTSTSKPQDTGDDEEDRPLQSFLKQEDTSGEGDKTATELIETSGGDPSKTREAIKKLGQRAQSKIKQVIVNRKKAKMARGGDVSLEAYIGGDKNQTEKEQKASDGFFAAIGSE